MKVSIVCDLLSTFLRFRRFLAEHIMAAGHDVIVIASVDDVDDKIFFDQESVSLKIVEMDRTSLNPFHDLGYMKRLRQAFLTLQPDRILAYQAKAAVWTAIAARALPNCKVAILFPGLGYLFSPNPTTKQRLVQFVSRQLYRYAFRTIDTAIFQNQDDIETLKSYNILADRTSIALVNGSGVCVDEFAFSVPPISPIRFVMATRLLADKGIREFAEAAGNLKDRHGDRVDFQIAGAVDSNPTAIKPEEINQWETAGWIRYRGLVSDMPEFLQQCSVFVLPSWYMEGTPRSILEAMATGRAIITTDNRGCKETVDHGVNGLIISQQNRLALEQAMEKLINNRDLVASMGRESRRIAEEKYEVRIVCQQMMDALLVR